MNRTSHFSKWMWYFGDFELFHSQKLHLRRTERNVVYPAFWFIPEPASNVRFKKTGSLTEAETICVTANGIGYVQVNGQKYAFQEAIPLPAGDYEILILVSNRTGLPAAFVEGTTIVSDDSWLADCYDSRWTQTGTNDSYTEKDQSPDQFAFAYRTIHPSVEPVDGGLLFDAGEETFAAVHVDALTQPVTLFFGESRQEALDTSFSYLCETVSQAGTVLEPKGFRYLFVPNGSSAGISLSFSHEYLPVERKASFSCSDSLLNQIWDVAAHTFELNSREFYMDGIKRDRWVWSGDSYQSYFINRYLCFDEDIVRRTITALGGKGEIVQHINTILDYTFYWIISISDYYEMTGDLAFVSRIFPRMKAYLDFSLSRLDANGFASGVEGDWVFVDWADMDKTGAVCAEQMLLLRSLEGFVQCGKLLHVDCSAYQAQAKRLKQQIHDCFWDEEAGAFIDSFESGKRNVTRHANLFALLFDYASPSQREAIISNVIFNDAVPQITTPYFKFYELEALCKIGRTDLVVDRMKAYWGEMIRIGATSFWEEYDPSAPWEEQLGMYGLKYGKSLCHAWGASPIYLIGRYLLGIRPLKPGYEAFEVNPQLDGIDTVFAQVPVHNGSVILEKKDNLLRVTADRPGGILIWQGNCFPLPEKETQTFAI